MKDNRIFIVSHFSFILFAIRAHVSRAYFAWPIYPPFATQFIRFLVINVGVCMSALASTRGRERERLIAVLFMHSTSMNCVSIAFSLQPFHHIWTECFVFFLFSVISFRLNSSFLRWTLVSIGQCMALSVTVCNRININIVSYKWCAYFGW